MQIQWGIRFISIHIKITSTKFLKAQNLKRPLVSIGWLVGNLKGVEKVYLHACIDTYGSYAFGFLHTGKKLECAAALVHNDARPFYQEHGLTVGTILTDNGREFCGTDNHPFELYLALNDIQHRRTKVKSPQTNVFIERSNKTVLDEFFRIAFRKNFYESVEALQEDLDKL